MFHVSSPKHPQPITQLAHALYTHSTYLLEIVPLLSAARQVPQKYEIPLAPALAAPHPWTLFSALQPQKARGVRRLVRGWVAAGVTSEESESTVCGLVLEREKSPVYR